jgi:hypothetical protein
LRAVAEIAGVGVLDQHLEECVSGDLVRQREGRGVSTRAKRCSAHARQTVESCPPENRTSALLESMEPFRE